MKKTILITLAAAFSIGSSFAQNNVPYQKPPVQGTTPNNPPPNGAVNPQQLRNPNKPAPVPADKPGVPNNKQINPGNPTLQQQKHHVIAPPASTSVPATKA